MGERQRGHERQQPCGITRAKQRSTEVSRIIYPWAITDPWAITEDPGNSIQAMRPRPGDEWEISRLLL